MYETFNENGLSIILAVFCELQRVDTATCIHSAIVLCLVTVENLFVMLFLAGSEQILSHYGSI
jgi:hypothetical protein